jgi:hypothetical protein
MVMGNDEFELCWAKPKWGFDTPFGFNAMV